MDHCLIQCTVDERYLLIKQQGGRNVHSWVVPRELASVFADDADAWLVIEHYGYETATVVDV